MVKRVSVAHAMQVLAGVLAGGAAGLLVFVVILLRGWSLFLVLGSTAGAGAVLLRLATVRQLREKFQLTTVKVMVPRVSELTFAINNDTRNTAWTLFIETITRVSTQPLADDAGFIRETLTSLYGLFSIIRNELKVARPSVSAPGSQTVEHLAVTMLNLELRPFLSSWHPRLTTFEHDHPDGPESAWAQREECRSELLQIQQNLVIYALSFARIAGIHDPESMISQEIRI